MKTEKKVVDCMMYGLKAPLIFPNQYGDSISKATRQRAELMRIAELGPNFDNEMCTDFEAMLYISCISLQVKLSYSATKIMHYCWKKYYGFDNICSNKDDVAYSEHLAKLDDQEIEDLNKLKRYIFKRQMVNLK